MLSYLSFCISCILDQQVYIIYADVHAAGNDLLLSTTIQHIWFFSIARSFRILLLLTYSVRRFDCLCPWIVFQNSICFFSVIFQTGFQTYLYNSLVSGPNRLFLCQIICLFIAIDSSVSPVQLHCARPVLPVLFYLTCIFAIWKYRNKSISIVFIYTFLCIGH